MTDPELLSALDEIVRGENVRRSAHALEIDGRDCTEAFCHRLAAHGYRPVTVREVDIAVDERVPAFLVDGGWARFGHVFWEKFTATRRRKLFGSVVRNAKGDWATVLPESSPVRVWAAPALRERVDPDRPTAF